MNQHSYVVETYRPPYPERGVRFRAHRRNRFSIDDLSPNMTAAFVVENVTNGEQAVACCIEKLAGKGTMVHPLYEKPTTPPTSLEVVRGARADLEILGLRDDNLRDAVDLLTAWLEGDEEATG
jgi:hypothetical protein